MLRLIGVEGETTMRSERRSLIGITAMLRRDDDEPLGADRHGAF
jgi:hypothetical protein